MSKRVSIEEKILSFFREAADGEVKLMFNLVKGEMANRLGTRTGTSSPRKRRKSSELKEEEDGA